MSDLAYPQRMITRLLNDASKVLGLKVVGLGLGFGLQIAIARWLGVEAFGTYTFCLSIAGIAVIIANLGVPAAAVRFVAQYASSSEWRKLKGFLIWSFALTAISSVACLVLTWLAVGLVVEVMPENSGPPMYVLTLLIVPYALLRLCDSVLRGFGEPVLAYWAENIGRPLLLLTAVGVAVSLGHPATAMTLALLTLGTFVVLGVVQTRFVLRRAGRTLAVRPAGYARQLWWSTALPLLLLASFQTVHDKVDILALGALASTAEVGVYHAASKIAGLLAIGLVSINAMLAPRVAALYHAGRSDELQTLLDQVMIWYLAPAVLGLLGFVVFGEHLLGAFGEDFRSGYFALLLIGLGQLLSASAGPVLLLLNMTGLQAISARIFALSIVVNVALNFLLIPRFGINGAAAASAVSLGLWNFVMLLVVRKQLQIHCHLLRVRYGLRWN